MRIALLSNVTADLLAGMLKDAHAVWTPPGFGAWMETALDPPPSLREFAPEAIFIVLDRSRSTVEDGAQERALASLEAAFPSALVFAPDIDDLADEIGGFHDERTWKLASMPWSLAGLRAIRDEISRILDSANGGYRKALAVDFDNTLWSGVIGEDGADGIRPFEAFQRGVKSLRERGVLVVGLSRNNPADVEPVWADSRMVLSKDDFAAMRIDWNDKASNLAAVAAELNIGVDAFAFVDDNPAECARMRAHLPEVATFQFPQDELLHPRFLRRLVRKCFPLARATGEDASRTSLYRDEAARRRFAEGLSLDEYLKGLSLWADVCPAAEADFARIAQLSQRSNQFNVLTNRYSAADVARMASDPRRLLVSARAGDRFGDQGLVAFVQASLDGDEAEIIDWVMSCRAMNRRLEYAIEERFEEMLQERGVRRVRASWRRTAKNAPARELFESFGFDVLRRGEESAQYALTLPRATPLAHHVSHIRLRHSPAT